MYKKKLFEINANFELEIDHALHAIKKGPFHLCDVRLAQIIIDSWIFLQEHQFVYICAICVMGNHVHALVRAPEGKETIDLGKLMNRHKSHTARLCNRILGTTGTQFWEKFYFDRTVRQGKFDRAMWYVLNNPVKSGQVKDWRDWPGTYLNPDFDALYRNPG
ncbi:transposase [Neolewinella agarilytica]|nr:transposase [Neolewinella agarilytica]